MIISSDAQRIADTLGPADAFVAQALDLRAARGLALDALLRLSRIEWCDDVATAAVECTHAPRLLLNPAFIAEHARSPHAVVFLILHELAHVSLGQTGVYRQATRLQNIAFDAVINASILRGLAFAGELSNDWQSFVVDFYREDESPAFILRPPPNWPAAPDWKASAGLNPKLRAIHRRLYGTTVRGKGSPISEVTHSEIIRALADEKQDLLGGAILLGNHGESEVERRLASGGRDARAIEVLGGVLDSIPNDGYSQPGVSTQLQERLLNARVEKDLVRQLRNLLKRSLSGAASVRRLVADQRPAMSVNPTKDRRAAVRRIIAERCGGPSPVLFRDEMVTMRSRRVGAAAVYLDVSGSMAGWMERLHAALRPLQRELTPLLYVFSNVVSTMSSIDLQKGIVRTTGGTDINPVLAHATHLGRTRVLTTALILTDGAVGAPRPDVLQELRATGIALHVGCTTNCSSSDFQALSQWAASATRLSAGASTK